MAQFDRIRADVSGPSRISPLMVRLDRTISGNTMNGVMARSSRAMTGNREAGSLKLARMRLDRAICKGLMVLIDGQIKPGHDGDRRESSLKRAGVNDPASARR